MDKEIKKYINAGKTNLIVIYILFLCGVVAPLLPIIGAVFAYINKDIKDKDNMFIRDVQYEYNTTNSKVYLRITNKTWKNCRL